MNYERFSFNVTMYVSLEISIIILWSLEMRLILTNTPRIKILSAHQMEPYIVGGAPIDLELCPSAVIIFNFGSMCAGSILNSYTVLTAAHCFEHNTDLDDITVHVGSQYRYDERASTHEVVRFVVHKDYNKLTLFSADIAIVFLELPIKFGKKARKAILVPHKNWRKRSENKFYVTGWGMIKYNGPLSAVGLLKTKLKYIPLKECAKLHGIKFSADMFCLYGDGKTDSCKGDSGGGVLWKGFLVGVVSHGDGCADKNKPSVYISTYYHRDWIERKILQHIKHFCKHT